MDLLSWGMQFPIGIGVGLLSQWLYGRFLRRRRARGAYLTVAHSSGGVDFEGRVETRNSTVTYSSGGIDIEIHVKTDIGKAHISAEEILKKLLESAKSVK